jgi:adenosylcobinamide-phosphate synthase
MASGAGCLNVLLGGAAVYHGVTEQRPTLGAGHTASAQHIEAALILVERSVILWLAMFIALALLSVPFQS